MSTRKHMVTNVEEFLRNRKQLKNQQVQYQWMVRRVTKIQLNCRRFLALEELTKRVIERYFINATTDHAVSRMYWLVWLARNAPISILLRDPTTKKRIKSAVEGDPVARLGALLRTGAAERPGYYVLSTSVKRWIGSRQSCYELPAFWHAYICSTFNDLTKQVNSIPPYMIPRAYEFIHICEHARVPNLERILQDVFPVLWSNCSNRGAINSLLKVESLLTWSVAKVLLSSSTWLTDVYNPSVWISVAKQASEQDLSTKVPRLLQSYCDSPSQTSHITDLTSLFTDVKIVKDDQFKLAVVLARACSVICESQARLPSQYRSVSAVCSVMRVLLNQLHVFDQSARDLVVVWLRKRSCIDAILMLRDLEKYTMVFVPTRVAAGALVRISSFTPLLNINPNSNLDKVAEQFLTEYIEEENEDLELVTYTKPIDPQLFDIVISNDETWSLLVRELGSVIFSAKSINEFVDSMGPAPGFVSDVSLLYRLLISYLLRRQLIMDDAQLICENDEPMTEEYTMKEIWYGMTSFPLKVHAVGVLFRFINHVSYLLLAKLWDHLLHHSIAISEKIEDFIVLDSCALSRLLARRLKRLARSSLFGLNGTVLTEWYTIQDLTNILLRHQSFGPRSPSDDFFGLTKFSYSPASQAKITMECLTQLPHACNFTLRISLLERILTLDREATGASDMRAPAGEIIVRRNNMVDGSIASMPKLQMLGRKRLVVKFIDEYGYDERGIDGGGLTREWLNSLAAILSDPAADLFEVHQATGSLIPNALYDEYVKHQMIKGDSTALPYPAHTLFELAGIVCGKAVYESMVLPSYAFSPMFINRVLSNSNSLDDLSVHDPDVYQSIKKVRDYNGDIKALTLDFTTSLTHKDLVVNVNLLQRKDNQMSMAGGLAVDNETKFHYCLLLANFLTNKIFDRAALAFNRGLTYYIPSKWQSLFDATEFCTVIAGQPSFDLADMKEHAVYASPFTEDHITIRHFWTILEQLDENSLRKFCRFVFSFDRPPILGFGSLNPKFAIISTGDSNSLPQASTCVNLLKLPPTTSLDDLRQKLDMSIHNTRMAIIRVRFGLEALDGSSTEDRKWQTSSFKQEEKLLPPKRSNGSAADLDLGVMAAIPIASPPEPPKKLMADICKSLDLLNAKEIDVETIAKAANSSQQRSTEPTTEPVFAGRMLRRSDQDDQTVRVTNLPDFVTSEELELLFNRVGNVQRTFLVRNKETQVSRGFAFITYRSRADALKAISMLNGKGFMGSVLTVEGAKRKAD